MGGIGTIIETYAIIIIGIIALNIAMIITFFAMYFTLKNMERQNENIIELLNRIDDNTKVKNTYPNQPYNNGFNYRP